MLETRARRIPLIDVDDDTKRAMIVNVVTQYRILKFVAVNVTETQLLRKPLRDLRRPPSPPPNGTNGAGSSSSASNGATSGGSSSASSGRRGGVGVGTYEGLVTARMDTPVIEVIHQLVRKSISSVPILNSDDIVVNVFEAVDVITLIKGGVYDDLTLSVGEALQKRALVGPFFALRP